MSAFISDKGERGEGAAGPWRCFHCDGEFTTTECAREHFGRFEDCLPACKIGVEQFRKMESELQDWRTESDPGSKSFYEMGARHSVLLIRAEEGGYEKGLADGRAMLSASPPPTPGTEGDMAGSEPSSGVGEGIAELVADLQRRAEACRNLQAPHRDMAEYERLEAKADTYDHAAELVATSSLNKLVSPIPSGDHEGLVEELKTLRFQIDSMVCGEDEHHAVYPDPNDLSARVDRILLALSPAGRDQAAGGGDST